MMMMMMMMFDYFIGDTLAKADTVTDLGDAYDRKLRHASHIDTL